MLGLIKAGMMNMLFRFLDLCRQPQQQKFFSKAHHSLTFRPPALSPLMPENSTILLLSAHADDEALGCLGIVEEHVRQGCQVVWVVVTDGRNANPQLLLPEEMAAKRHLEAEKVRQRIGLELVWWGEPCPASLTQDLIDRLAELIRSVKPAMIYAPFSYNHHPEHRMVARIAAKATPDDIPIRWYPIQTPLTPIFTTGIYTHPDLSRLTEEVVSLYTSQRFMERSFRAAIQLQILEGRLYLGKAVPVQAICEISGDMRAPLIDALADDATRKTPVKPNIPARLWHDYRTLWAQAHATSMAIGWKLPPEKVLL